MVCVYMYLNLFDISSKADISCSSSCGVDFDHARGRWVETISRSVKKKNPNMLT